MATYTFNISRCAGGNHVHLIATEQGGEVINIELMWDNLRAARRAKDDYRDFPDPIADILVELRKQLIAAGVSTFAQVRTFINSTSVTI